jgi:MSHA pilin protein MshD
MTQRLTITRGLTLVEAMVAMTIVSVLLVAAMRAVGGAGLNQYKNAERVTAAMLADGLMAEILSKSYADPNQTPSFGVESGETSRSLYDDVDDYNGYAETSSPKDSAGTTVAGSTWARSVVVDRVVAATPSTVSATETGVKRITITVTNRGRTVLQRVALRTDAP